MDGQHASAWTWWGRPAPSRKRWVQHGGHEGHAPHGGPTRAARRPRLHLVGAGEETALADNASEMVTLDGSRGEGGGQILRTALSLSLLTGRAFRIAKIRANRDKPGLRPQHLAAVEAAAALCGGKVTGAAVGARELVFRPRPYEPRDLDLDIGTAGATTLVLHTLALPIALRADGPVRLTLAGGTFNDRAPSFPFLETTWRGYLARLGLTVGLAMPSAGFYPVGGGRLEAWIEPGQPHPFVLTERGPLRQIRGVSGVSNLHRHAVAERMAEQARSRLSDLGLDAEIALADWPGRAQGAAIALTAEHDVPGSPRPISSTFVGLGARGKPAERVADEAVDELLAYLDAPGAGVVDPHSADQLLLPLALAEGTSVFTVSDVTEHLRTNASTIRAFLDRDIRIDEPDDDRPGRVIVA